MVMFDLFREAGIETGVAHCNFQLRGTDSDDDEAWVEEACRNSGVPFHVRRFDTADYASSRRLSIQMAARQLRYSFFGEILLEKGYQWIATAHHHNDNIETVILNLARGSGLDGLTGIPIKNGNVIRPLLFASRSDIEEYASRRGIQWREDASNATEDYQRNVVRRRVIPLLEEINPGLADTFGATLERIAGAHQWVARFIRDFADSHVRLQDDQMTIAIRPLRESGAAATLLWELTKDKGYNFGQCREIMDTPHQAGKKFLSANYQLSIDRELLIIQPITFTSHSSVLIDKDASHVASAMGELIIGVHERENFLLRKDSSLAQLDLDRIAYPLTWRSWLPGDTFTPLGMDQPKKVSDLLIDNKVSVPDKQKITVVESAGTIVWVVGMRINEHFKVTGHTRRVLVISFQRKQP